MSNFGIDLIFAEILPKLSVKSLMRFKCVSKSFEAHISFRDFAQLYLRHHSLSSNANDLLVLPGENNVSCYELDSTATPTINFKWNSFSVSIVGSSNGLLCIRVQNWVKIDKGIFAVSYFSVINPVTRTCQDIPSVFPVTGDTNLGFAFDLLNLDFKLVAVCDQHSKTEIKTLTRITKVYSINTNSWTVIKTDLPGDIMVVNKYGGGTVVNNSLLHWIFRRGTTFRECRIGCFDVCRNKWVNDVLLPHCSYDLSQKYYVRDIAVLDDLLCSTILNEVEMCFDVWLMKEYGIQDSWFKWLSIPVSNDGMTPVACRGGSAEVLIRECIPSARLLWYNRNNGGIRQAKFDGAPDFSFLQVYMCSRSTVDLPGGRIFEDPHNYPGEIANGEIVYDLLEGSNS